MRLNSHFRRTFFAGVLAVVPIAITIFIIYWVEVHTLSISDFLFKKEIPFVGVAVAIAGIYLSGLLATTLVGRFFLRVIDRILTRVPMIREVYIAWKQIALTPGGVEGTFSKVVLIPDDSGHARTLGFTSGRPIDTAGHILCVYIPFVPNPVSGKLVFVALDKCLFPDVSPEEAFKILLSTGNYVPLAFGNAISYAPAAALLSDSEPATADLAPATLDRRIAR